MGRALRDQERMPDSFYKQPLWIYSALVHSFKNSGVSHLAHSHFSQSPQGKMPLGTTAFEQVALRPSQGPRTLHVSEGGLWLLTSHLPHLLNHWLV